MDKFKILNEIEKHCSVFYKSGNEFRTRCPFCGDSQKNLKSAHFYIKCSSDLTEPIMYHCFKCNRGGILNNELISAFGINGVEITKEVNNKIFYFKNNKMKIDNELLPSSVNYIKYRVGEGLTTEDLLNFRLISLNKLKEVVKSKRVTNTLPNDSEVISFINEDNSLVLMRSLFDNYYRWRKIQLFDNGVSVYTIKTQLDLFTKANITINIAEGIFDVISIYKNFKTKNSVFIAVLSSDYFKGVEYCINKGIIGSNIDLNFYLDQDVSEIKLKKELKQIKWVFGDIKLYKNAVDKDFGVCYEKIKLIEV